MKTFIKFPDSAGMEDIFICQDTWAGSSKVLYTLVASVAQFFVPVILVIILYLSIYLKLRNRPQVRRNKQILQGGDMVISLSSRTVIKENWFAIKVRLMARRLI